MKVNSQKKFYNQNGRFLYFWTLFLIVPPLFVIEILHRALDVFEDYFNECSEAALKENFVIVYEVIIIFLLEKSISVNRLIIIKTN